MNYKIKIDPMPKTCAECPLYVEEAIDFGDDSWRHCNLEMWSIEGEGFAPGFERHKNCPLEPM